MIKSKNKFKKWWRRHGHLFKCSEEEARKIWIAATAYKKPATRILRDPLMRFPNPPTG